MSFNDFSSHGHRMLQPQIIAALASLEQHLGVKFEADGGTIGGDSLTFKITAKTGDPALAQAGAQRDFDRYCRHYGLEPQDL